MNIYDATEQAYKNGYEAGVKALAEKLKAIGKQDGAYDYISLWDIDEVLKEMMER